jgi:hypothetical protein
LLPPGYGESLHKWGRIFYHNYWGVAGLDMAASLFRAAGAQEDADYFGAQAQEFREAVRAAVRASFIQSGVTGGYIPAAPGAQGSRIWGNIAAIYPCGVLDPLSPEISSTFERMWENREWDLYRFIDNTNKVWTYITADWAIALLQRGEWQRANTLLAGFRAVASPVYGWWEEHFIDSGRGTGDAPHAWAAANYVLWLRHIFVSERGEHELELLSGVPPEWRIPGSPLRAENLPTELGLLQWLEVRTEDNGVVVVDARIAPHEPTPVSFRVKLRGLSILRAECDAPSTMSGDSLLVDGPAFRCRVTPAP